MDTITNNSKPFQCSTPMNKRTDNWVMIPSDLAECPKVTNLDFSVVCVRHDFANDVTNKSRSVRTYSYSFNITYFLKIIHKYKYFL